MTARQHVFQMPLMTKMFNDKQTNSKLLLGWNFLILGLKVMQTMIHGNSIVGLNVLHKENSIFIRIKIDVWVIDQVWGQDGWILAKFFFCVFMDRDGKISSRFTKDIFTIPVKTKMIFFLRSCCSTVTDAHLFFDEKVVTIPRPYFCSHTITMTFSIAGHDFTDCTLLNELVEWELTKFV